MNVFQDNPQTAPDGERGGASDRSEGPVAPQEGTQEGAPGAPQEGRAGAGEGGAPGTDRGGVAEPGEGPVAPQEGTQD